MSDKQEAQFLRLHGQVMAHAQAEYPRECCGLLVKERRATRSRVVYVPCRNIAPEGAQRDRFVLHPLDYAAAEERGDVLAVVHSHPDASAHPSEADRAACHASGLVWYVVACPGGAWKRIEPAALPLIGRRFEHGAVDCYTLVRDHYRQVLNIELPDFERADGWWERRPGHEPEHLYREGFAKAGFIDLGPPCGQMKPHDVLLMTYCAEVDNHAAVFLGDAQDGRGTLILQHLYGRLSGRDVWGGEWAACTTSVLRHEALMGNA